MKYQFPKNFWWGAATSGIQTEGNENKVNESIWDLWYEKNPERFALDIGPQKTCQTYNYYKQDVQNMSDISLNSIRTSIQWSRLISNFETGEVDQDAVDFYNNYFDEMLSKNIIPTINLFHFDMPRILQENYGGFESKHVVDLFVLYAKKVFELFGSKIKYFTTFNEPIVPVEGGYFYDFHYPCKADAKMGIQVGFNTLLAHSKVVELYRSLDLKGEIGIILNLTPSYPKSDDKDDVYASKVADAFFNCTYLDPILRGTFPKIVTDILKQNDMIPQYSEEDLAVIINEEIDFLGVNYYVPRRVQAKKTNHEGPFTKPENYFDYYVNPEGRFNPYRDNNEIYPKCVYDIAKTIQTEYGNIKWYLAEIGIAMDLESEGNEVDGIIDDSFRTDLLKEHFIYLHQAIEEGSNCFGVHMWTFIDCWSWTNSFVRRYGFYRLDYKTGMRTIKSNALWYKNLSENNYFEQEINQKID